MFEAKDPRGRTVACSEDCWHNHILKARRWMKGYVERVRDTIENPDIIMQDADYKDRESYYRLDNQNYIKVVVVFDSNASGIVKTAYVSDSIKNREVIVWAK